MDDLTTTQLGGRSGGLEYYTVKYGSALDQIHWYEAAIARYTSQPHSEKGGHVLSIQYTCIE
jgi:hypothetical protein